MRFKVGDVYYHKTYKEYGVITYNTRGIDFMSNDDSYELVVPAEDVKKCFEVGERITGFCSGYFGRDDYESKVCILQNNMFAVFQYKDGLATVLNYPEDDEFFWHRVETWRRDK